VPDFIPNMLAIEEIPQSPGMWTLLDEIGQEGASIAKRLVLVDDGELRASIRYRFTVEDGLPEVQIGADALNKKGEGYALHVEYGEFNTADEAPKGAFLRPMLMALKIP
jgi:hypothetical protein